MVRLIEGHIDSWDRAERNTPGYLKRNSFQFCRIKKHFSAEKKSYTFKTNTQNNTFAVCLHFLYIKVCFILYIVSFIFILFTIDPLGRLYLALKYKPVGIKTNGIKLCANV